MAVRHRKGQMFLIGTLLFAGLITSIVILNQGGTTSFPGTQRSKALFDRGMNEYPAALNTVIETNSSGDQVKRRTASYLDFHAYTVRGQGLENREHTVIALPNSSGVTAVVGNFRGETMENAWITVGGTSKDLENLDAGETRLTGFPGASGKFRVMFNATADRTINNSFGASLQAVHALYSLRIEGEDQVWSGTRVY